MPKYAASVNGSTLVKTEPQKYIGLGRLPTRDVTFAHAHGTGWQNRTELYFTQAVLQRSA